MWNNKSHKVYMYETVVIKLMILIEQISKTLFVIITYKIRNNLIT